MASHIVKQVSNSGLSSGNQNGVWRQLIIDIRLTGASRSQFTDIVIVLYEWYHSGYQMPAHFGVKVRRFHADTPAYHLNPLVKPEVPAMIDEILQVRRWHLNRLQRLNLKRAFFR